MQRTAATLALLVAGAGWTAHAAPGPGGNRMQTCPLWQPLDLRFESAARHANPFVVSFAAEVTGPAGARFTLPGFYDGGGAWKVRVSPRAEGEWSVITRSDDPALDGKRASFRCVANPNPRVHGGLRVDPESPHHFVWEDGSRFFLMGYECDWLWALDTGKPDLPTVDPFLDRLAANGFNYVILNSFAYDCGWRKGKTGPDDYGPPPLFAWAGTYEETDYARLNLEYWQHYDRVIEALHRRGMVAHILVKVYNKSVRWPAKGSPEDELFFRWLVARYAAYPNVVWDFSKEAHNEKDLEYKIGRMEFLRRHDPYARLRTVHDDDAANDGGAYDSVVDFRADQQHGNWRAVILRQRARRAYPVVNVEFGYEHGPGGLEDKTYRVAQAPEEVCRRAWEICTAGGYTAYYYTYTAWDVVRPEDNPPGYALFRRLRETFERTRYWRMAPAEGCVSAGYCLADPGAEYLVFLNKAEAFTFTPGETPRPLRAEWIHPFTGERRDAGTLRGPQVELVPPPEWGESPVALHAGAE